MAKFVFDTDWFTDLEEYPADVRSEVLEAVIKYTESGTLSELTSLANIAFRFIRREIDKEQEHYKAIVEVRREAGHKGGAPIGNQNAKRYEQKQAKTSKNKQKQAKQTNGCFGCFNVSDNASDSSVTNTNSNDYKQNEQNKQMVVLENAKKENENEKENEKEKVIQKEKDKEKDKEKESVCTPFLQNNPPISDDYRRFIDWMRENAPYCNSHMTLPTEKEFLSLKQMWAAADIADQILNIENRLDLRKKYKSLYRTLLNWLKHATGQKKYTA